MTDIDRWETIADEASSWLTTIHQWQQQMHRDRRAGKICWTEYFRLWDEFAAAEHYFGIQYSIARGLASAAEQTDLASAFTTSVHELTDTYTATAA